MRGPPPIVLIVGFPRSGTTLVRTALGSHPRLCAYPSEGYFLLRTNDSAWKEEQTQAEVTRSLERLELELPKETILQGINRAFEGAERRTPYRTLLHVLESRCAEQEGSVIPLLKFGPMVSSLEQADNLFPGMKVVHVIRDPRGAIASHAARWPEGGLWHRIQGWKQSIVAGREWRKDHERRYHQVQYEALLKNPEEGLRSVCEFVGIEYRPEVTQLNYVTLEFDPQRRGESSKRKFTGFDQSKIEQWKETLGAHEVQLIEARCASEMRELGYVRSNPETLSIASLAHLVFERTRYAFAQMRDRLLG